MSLTPVLILSYYFPPMGGAGTQRFAKFVKWLPEFGYKPIVVTTDQSASPYAPSRDDTLLDDIPNSAVVERVGEDAELPSFAARVASWIGRAGPVAQRVGREHGARALVTTCSPFELARLGEELKQELGVPWLLDLRDPWALDRFLIWRTPLHYRRELASMRRAFRAADVVIANTPESAAEFGRVFPFAAQRCRVITNGFDDTDFQAPPAIDLAARFDGRCVLVHTGGFQSSHIYPPTGLAAAVKGVINHQRARVDRKGRTPYYLAQAMRALRDAGEPLIEKLVLVLVGNRDPHTVRCFEDAGVSDLVHWTGYVDHRRSVAHLLAADGLFLPLHHLPAGLRSLLTPGKAYEYLAAGRPIVGNLPAGDARDLVEASGLGYLAPASNPGALAEPLRLFLEHWSSGRLPAGRPELAAGFERRELTRRLAEAIGSVVTTG
jgi:glycosyltransferase involved in cell wall biosynthesis